MDFSDQLCFRKLLTVLHRFLKTLFIMKSTKTIFAISSIRCIKPLNSSSSCSPEQVYFSKKQKQNGKKKRKKKSKIFIKYNDAKKKEKKKRKRKLQFSGYAQRPRRLIQVHDRIFAVLFILCLICPFFFQLYEMGFLKSSIVQLHPWCCSVLASVAVTQCWPHCLCLASHFPLDVV